MMNAKKPMAMKTAKPAPKKDDMPSWAKQEMEDRKMMEGSKKAYDKAMPTPERYAKGGKVNPFAGKESKKEEAMERKKFPSKKAYKAAEKKMEGEKYACGGKVRGGGAAKRGVGKGIMR